MNEPAYQFYLGKNPYVDLETDHARGRRVRAAQQRRARGRRVVAVERRRASSRSARPAARTASTGPGGAALNSGPGRRDPRGAVHRGPPDGAAPRPFDEAAAAGARRRRSLLVGGASARAAVRDPRQHRRPAARGAGADERQGRPGALRASRSTRRWSRSTPGCRRTSRPVSADASSRRSINRTFLVRDILDHRVRVPVRDGRLRRARRPVARLGALHRRRRSCRWSGTASTRARPARGVPVHASTAVRWTTRCRRRRWVPAAAGGPSSPRRRRPRRRAGVPLAPAPPDPRGRRLLRERLAGVPRAREHPLMRIALPDPRVEIRGAAWVEDGLRRTGSRPGRGRSSPTTSWPWSSRSPPVSGCGSGRRRAASRSTSGVLRVAVDPGPPGEPQPYDVLVDGVVVPSRRPWRRRRGVLALDPLAGTTSGGPARSGRRGPRPRRRRHRRAGRRDLAASRARPRGSSR